MVIIPFFSKHIFLKKKSLQIFPQFKVRKVDLTFHNLPLCIFGNWDICLFSVPGTSHILYEFTKNIDNNPEIISESPFNS